MALGDLSGLMKQAQDLQSKMAKAQAEVGEKTVAAAAGGGMVSVVVNGRMEVVSIKLETAVLSEDIELVQDLILAAVNEGLRAARKMVADEIGKLTGGLKIPGLT